MVACKHTHRRLEGPFRDLNRIRIVETIAETIRAAPLVNAMTRAGAAAMIAAPLMFGGASVGTAAAAGGLSIVIHYSPTINADNGSRDEWARAAEKHGDLLTRIIEDRLARRDRRSWIKRVSVAPRG
jgi:hypothetical protein